MVPAQLVWITLAIRASRLLYLAVAKRLEESSAKPASAKPVHAPRGGRQWFRRQKPVPPRKAGQLEGSSPGRWFWFGRPEPPAPPPPGLLEGFRNWWRGWTTAAPPRPPAARPKPSAVRESRKGTPGAVAVLLVWLPAVVVAVSAPELFDRLLLVAAVSGGLLWLMQSRGGRQKDDA